MSAEVMGSLLLGMGLARYQQSRSYGWAPLDSCINIIMPVSLVPQLGK
jgi:hypothetical protein